MKIATVARETALLVTQRVVRGRDKEGLKSPNYLLRLLPLKKAEKTRQ